MSPHYIEHPLQNGYVHNWLVAGPQAVSLAPPRANLRAATFARFHTPTVGISATPVERGPLDAGKFTVGKYAGSWSYVACGEDHAVDHSAYYAACHYLRSWAYVEAVSARPQRVTVALMAYGAADVWAGEKHVGRMEDAAHESGTTRRFTVQLGAGVTPLWVRFEQVGMGHVAHAMSLRLMSATGDAGERAVEGVHVRFRTLIDAVERRNAFEELSADAFVERDVYAGNTPMALRWPEGKRASCFAHVRLQTPDGRIFLAGDSSGEGGQTLQMGYALQLPAGPLQVTLMPNPNEVYLQHVRISRTLPLWSLGRQRYAAAPWGDLPTRRHEALVHAGRVDDSPFAQVARMAFGAWAEVDAQALLATVQRVARREHGSDLALLALSGCLYRFGDHANFPLTMREALEKSALAFPFADAPRNVDDALTRHTCELLAGQLWDDHTFADGQTGAWHRTHGEAWVKGWITQFGARGMAAWNAPAAIEQAVVALTHLCDLAASDEIFELATVALDKLFFMLAHNSWRGVWTAAGQRVDAETVKSALLQPTAPLCNLMWGMGIYNEHVAGLVSLACCVNYQMPALFEQIALHMPDATWAREQHATAHPAANVVSYRTPDFVLSSVQDYGAGERGTEELVWRATLLHAEVDAKAGAGVGAEIGAEVTVFANHPATSSESPSRTPGFWAGNHRLPRVAQWHDALLAVHRIEDDDLFDFTHAYFPTATMDEHALRQGWIFGRVGNGYMALTNSQPISLTQKGRYALREVRAQGQTVGHSGGQSQSWVVQMGRAALDGDFAVFQRKVLALPLRFGDAGEVEFTTLHGNALRFGWNGPLTVDGAEVALHNFPHYENAYTTTALDSGAMVVQLGDDGVRLEFGVV